MIRLLRHTVASLALGIVLAGFVSAILMAIVPAGWRGPRAVAAAILATLATVVRVRGIRPPGP